MWLFMPMHHFLFLFRLFFFELSRFSLRISLPPLVLSFCGEINALMGIRVFMIVLLVA